MKSVCYSIFIQFHYYKLFSRFLLPFVSGLFFSAPFHVYEFFSELKFQRSADYLANYEASAAATAAETSTETREREENICWSARHEQNWNYFNRRSLKIISLQLDSSQYVKGQTCLLFVDQQEFKPEFGWVVVEAENKQKIIHF